MQKFAANQPSSRYDGFKISVAERNDEAGAWTVEAIDMADDGDIYQAIFYGKEAEKRAHEYARFKYGV
jgi:hypothetical protein